LLLRTADQCSAGKVEKASRSSAASANMLAASSKRPLSWPTTRPCWAHTLSWSGCSKMVRTRVATMPWDDFGTLVRTFRLKWTLCRGRPNVHYADVRVMPTRTEVPLWDLGFVAVRSA
jgi:hypothetical protein